jgi:phage baseplate assembly protein W
MAYIVNNIDVLDLKPSTGVGINLPFNGPTGINTTYTTKDAIKANLLNFLLTAKRERVLNPQFGSGLPDLLFEPVTEDFIAKAESLIFNGIETFFPQVQILNLNVDLLPDRSTVVIYLKYTVINTNIEDELQLNLNNGGV